MNVCLPPSTRDALPGGPSEVAYTPDETIALALEALSLRLDRLSQRHYPRCSHHAVMRLIARLNLNIYEIEQHAGGSRA